jgi:hypothetical protein
MTAKRKRTTETVPAATPGTAGAVDETVAAVDGNSDQPSSKRSKRFVEIGASLDTAKTYRLLDAMADRALKGGPVFDDVFLGTEEEIEARLGPMRDI